MVEDFFPGRLGKSLVVSPSEVLVLPRSKKGLVVQWGTQVSFTGLGKGNRGLWIAPGAGRKISKGPQGILRNGLTPLEDVCWVVSGMNFIHYAPVFPVGTVLGPDDFGPPPKNKPPRPLSDFLLSPWAQGEWLAGRMAGEEIIEKDSGLGFSPQTTFLIWHYGSAQNH